ncbi:putative Permease [Magnetospirillum gryphiswaldense MSR-1 v2]|uniref:Permease n=1 Tax=Magnetospirillum gryphiswaldense (strain DSM 6361 / JCM 21280 / NBRC 15271 / MSR-1) TaxID=431944 RepID=V6EZN9_MAGGM|nr:putative permease [Magnetospirillum gryphiswaldense]CDK98622.1 putative Permease [Magnetospirillum gryphiswaldense MSR-1 v2]
MPAKSMHLQQNHLRLLELRLWLLVSVAALAVAGGLALGLALARTPGVQDWLPSGPDFFHKALVTHVVFSFQVWLLAMLAAASAQGRAAPLPGLVGVGLTITGCALLLVVTLAGWGEASLNNYVPVLDHPLYLAGLGLIATGIACALFRPGNDIPAMAFAYAVALICFAIAVLRLPSDLDAAFRYERLFWGGGHVLQFVNTGLIMWAWRRLAGGGSTPLSRLAFALLAAGTVAALVIELRLDPLGLSWRQAYTDMLWYLLPLPPILVAADMLWHRRRVGGIAGLALWASWLVFVLGGMAGFALGAGDTRTPSHYHAMIGGVNVALMGVIHVVLLPALGRAAPSLRLVRWQIGLYGGGQLLHALGFYLAGLAGVARKTAGVEQGLDSVFKLVSMGVVGLGGTIAVLGGVLFVGHVLARLVRHD